MMETVSKKTSAKNLQKALALVKRKSRSAAGGGGLEQKYLGETLRQEAAGSQEKAARNGVQANQAQERPAMGACAAVFDLDSTLFCMKYRTEAILKGFVKESAGERAKQKLVNLKVRARDWSVEEIFSRYDLPPEDPVTKAAKSYWNKRFFTNEFLLKWDRPYPGAAEYVKRMEGAGAAIFYLTGRSRGAMGRGSLLSLKKWGFPLPNKNPFSRLILKENADDDDALYKLGKLAKIQKQYKLIVFFENEPVILNKAAEVFPKIRLFWIDSAHSRQALPPKSALPILPDYR